MDDDVVKLLHHGGTDKGWLQFHNVEAFNPLRDSGTYVYHKQKMISSLIILFYRPDDKIFFI